MTADILGIRFDGLTVDEAVERALALISARQVAYVCTPNPEIVWAARKNSALRGAIEGAAMTLPDGVGVVWASKVLGFPLPERVSGYDLLLALLARFQGTVFLLGGRPGVAERAAGAIKKQFPAVTVAGCHDGYFEDGEAVLQAVSYAAPDMVLVCLGSPRQELWMAQNARGAELPPCLMMGLGGSLDVLAGDVSRAPESWRRAGLEWLYRLLHDPRRLKRQLCLPLFVGAVLLQRIKKRGSKEPQGQG